MPNKDDVKGTIDYHPFQTLFQITCQFIKAHEPLTIRASHINEVDAKPSIDDAPKPKAEVQVINTQPIRSSGPNMQGGHSHSRPLTCHGCGSADHFVRNCPSVPKCPHCGRRGHSPNHCWGPTPRRGDPQHIGHPQVPSGQAHFGYNMNTQNFTAPYLQPPNQQQYHNTNPQHNGYHVPSLTMVKVQMDSAEILQTRQLHNVLLTRPLNIIPTMARIITEMDSGQPIICLLYTSPSPRDS